MDDRTTPTPWQRIRYICGATLPDAMSGWAIRLTGPIRYARALIAVLRGSLSAGGTDRANAQPAVATPAQPEVCDGLAPKSGRRPGRAEVAVVATAPRTGLSASSHRSSWVAMDSYADLIRRNTVLGVLVVPVTGGRADVVSARIRELRRRVDAVFLLGLDSAESAAVQSTAAAHGLLVVTEHDTLAATVAAATVTVLRGRGILPGQGRVAVIGGHGLPRVAAVLIGTGAGHVRSYAPGQIPGPGLLQELRAEHDVVVDLTGAQPTWTPPSRTVSLPEHLADFAGLALPGLLSALCGHGTSSITDDALAAAARAIALLTPVDCPLPAAGDRRLVSTVAVHVGRALSDRQGEFPPAQS